MRLKKYSSDLSAKSWQFIEDLLIVQRTSKHDLREIVNGILYVSKNGCVWRDLPGEFPAWGTVYWYFAKWVKDGTWERLSQALSLENRLLHGKAAEPTVAMIDSQSVKNAPTCTENVGVDGGKKIKGRKRFVLVDSLGNLLDSFVTAANCHDGTTAIKYYRTLSVENPLLEKIEKIFADGTFGGKFSQQMQAEYQIEVEIPKDPIAKKGAMTIHAMRWIVERSIAWMNNNRRCSKDYERKTQHANAFILIANISRIAKLI